MDRDAKRGTAAPPGEAARVGLYFCRCGPNPGGVVRTGALDRPDAWPGVADVATQDVLCSPDGRAWLERRVRARGLDRVVVAACSPREHDPAFRAALAAAGRSPWALQRVNLREQVDWIGGDAAAATERARRLVAAALRRVLLHRDLPAEEIELSPDVLVVGAGPAGLSAALALAGKERRVFLVEREHALGGHANLLDEVFPDRACGSCFMAPALDRVLHSDRIEPLTGAEVRRVRGALGSFEVELAVAPRGVDPAACLACGACARACPAARPDPSSAGLATRKAVGVPYPGALPHSSALDPAACLRAAGERCDACATACPVGAVTLDGRPELRTVTVGAIVLAVGMSPGTATGPAGVVSTWQLERMLHPDGPTAGAVRAPGGAPPRSVLLAPAGPDDDLGLAGPELLKLAGRLVERVPGARVAVAGGLDRVPALARGAAALAARGVLLLPGHVAPDGVADEGGRLAVQLDDGGAVRAHAAELVVLHPAARPAEGIGALARLLRLDAGPQGFLLARGASPFEPTATRIAGVHVAGAAAGPRTIAEAIRDGAAAAALVAATLRPGERRPLEPLAAEIAPGRCSGCGVCASACPFGAIEVEEGTARATVVRVHCRGCGTCAAACPSGAVSAPHFTREQIAAEISALLAAPPPPAGDR